MSGGFRQRHCPMCRTIAAREEVHSRRRAEAMSVAARSPLRKVMGTRWPPFCLQHPLLYNPATISSLLTRAGFGDIVVEGSRNYFPLDFVARQATWTVGIKPPRWLPLPRRAIGRRLGNMIPLAGAPRQSAAPRRAKRLEAVS